MTDTNTKYFYLRDEWRKYISVPLNTGGTGISLFTSKEVRGNPIACIAYERFTDPDVEGQDYVLFSLSIANPKDEFKKSLARHICYSRLNSVPGTVNGVNVDEDATSSEVVKEILTCVAEFSDLPKRVRKSACDWLNQVR